MNMRVRALSALSLTLTLAAGCGDGDTTGSGGAGGGAGGGGTGGGGTGGSASATSFDVTIENITPTREFRVAGVFDTPVGDANPGPATPGKMYEFRVGALPGERLSFTTMFGQSNDLFYAPSGSGIALFDDKGMPMSGDVTSQIMLWDAGTEANEEPGAGPNQAPRQSAPNTGAPDPDNTVRQVNDSFTYPAVSDVIQVMIKSEGGNEFTVQIKDVSQVGTLNPPGGMPAAAPISPGVYVVHSMDNPLFTPGQPNKGNGLEAQAEDGNPMALHSALKPLAGLTSPLSPGVAVVHRNDGPLFTSGQADRGKGLEAQAEDGNPSSLAASLEAEAGMGSGISSIMIFNTPEGESNPGPLTPGSKFLFTLSAVPGDRLSFASMLGQTNDIFLGTDEAGIALFDTKGMPMSGDVTDHVFLWDTGTEANQWPGVGPDQAPRQAAPNTGAADPTNQVRKVDDGYAYPMPSEIVKVTISPKP